VSRARALTDEFFAAVDRWMNEGRPPNHRITTPGLFPDGLADELERLGTRVRELGQAEEQRDKATELVARGIRCLDLADEIRALNGLAHGDHVHWAEREGDEGRNLVLTSAPVDVGPQLAEHLWDRLKGFRPLGARIGIGDTENLLLGSPFRYSEQARLIIDARLPDPREAERYEDALPDAVLEHVARTNGHAFVLFTSFQSLDRCHAACLAALRGMGCTVLKQGEGMQRTRMIEEFKKSPSPVLFGTDSFWEGVDVQGNVLRNVIIARLPFAVPTHPLQEARTQAIKDRGGDAFGEYALPAAILKLKQGFGRLIRSTRDQGIVVVLDRRMATMSYGKKFIAALPDVPVEILRAPAPPRDDSGEPW
jgi:ATP-dependent DNA helicase DinG